MQEHTHELVIDAEVPRVWRALQELRAAES